MFLLSALVFLVLGALALRGARWAYASFVVLGLLFFPARVGFRLEPRACELALDLPLAFLSLRNHEHIVLFAAFFVMTRAQFRSAGVFPWLWAALATMAMGVAVEIAEGVTGKGHCRLRDLVPDGAGALLGTAIVLLWRRIRGPQSRRPMATPDNPGAGG
jgi:hypothetical protein